MGTVLEVDFTDPRIAMQLHNKGQSVNIEQQNNKNDVPATG